MGRLPRYVMNSRKGFGLVERGLYKTLVLLLNNTCTARERHLCARNAYSWWVKHRLLPECGRMWFHPPLDFIFPEIAFTPSRTV